jgi:fumarylacetoacetase
MALTMRSWVPSANDPRGDFPLENLPLGVFRRARMAGAQSRSQPAIGVAIGDRVLDLRAAARVGLMEGLAAATAGACVGDSLNGLMGLGRSHWRPLRQRLTELLSDPQHQDMVEPLLVPIAEAEMLPPAVIGDYTDFYASIYHATNVGKLFRPDNPLLPNYKWVPIGYHGRASSIVVSGAPVRRPRGQSKDAAEETPRFGPSRSLDYEVEVGLLIGQGSPLGEPIPMDTAEEHIFGLCLVNDWSARDLQAWEYQPLGPFLAKSFATSISPWVVTMDALEPFRAPAFARADGDPQPLPYLTAAGDRERGGIDLTLEVYLSSRKMRAEGAAPLRVSRGNLRDLYWTPAQLVAHHASNGCNLRPGDLLASGTVSGATRDAAGCLLEITRRGAEPLALPGGETRRFLEDGDEVTIRGYCEREGAARIGFGECRGMIEGGGPG